MDHTAPENLWELATQGRKGKGSVNPVTYNALSRRRGLWRPGRAFGWENNARHKWRGRSSTVLVHPANGARHSFGSYGYWRDFRVGSRYHGAYESVRVVPF